MYVPIVQVYIQPVKNANRPGIESNHRPVRCPAYMVPLYKAKWGPTAKVVSEPITDAEHVDRLWKVPQLPGLSLVESEISRLRNQFGKRTFGDVYREGEFEDLFNKVAVEVNPQDERRRQRDEEIASQAVERAAKGVMAVARSEAVTAARKNAKNKPARQTVPADADGE